MAILLPRYITFNYNGAYYEYDNRPGQTHAAVRNTSNTILSEKNLTKFEVVSSRIRGMVHIRTCYNNKFLELNNNFFYATADEPEEDRAKRSCTLFRFVISDDRVGFYHQAQNVERPVRHAINFHLEIARSSGGTKATMFRYWDMSSLAILPKHVLFKGDNGKYLEVDEDFFVPNFAGNDPQNERVRYTSMLMADGEVCFLYPKRNMFLERDLHSARGELIMCKRFVDPSQLRSRNSRFRAVKQSSSSSSSQDNTIALLNMGNNKYCERMTRRPRDSYLLASSLTIPRNAVFTVEEALRDRQIYDIRYHIEDARTHGVVPLQAVPTIAYNRGYEPATATLQFSYKEVMEEMFASSHSWKLSYNANLTVSLVPKLVKGELTLSATYSGKVEWSKRNRTEKTVTGSISVLVPPRSIQRVTLIVGQGSTDVPFSYIQRDILMDGTIELKEMEDGLFLGVNTFEFQYDVGEPESLPSSAKMPPSQDDIVIVQGEPIELPRMAIPRVVGELEVEEEEVKLIPPIKEEDQGEGGRGKLVRHAMSSKL